MSVASIHIKGRGWREPVGGGRWYYCIIYLSIYIKEGPEGASRRRRWCYCINTYLHIYEGRGR